MTQATLTLRSDPSGNGLDGLTMDVDFHGDFDPTSTAHLTIDYLANMLVQQSEAGRAAAAAEADKGKVRLLLPTGGARV